MRSDARAADPRALARTARLPLTAGRITDLDDGSVIVSEAPRARGWTGSTYG